MLIPLTLFCIILVNFVIINLAPGDPVSFTEISSEGGASRREDRSIALGGDQRYLQFREFYGLTLPILFNTWPWLDRAYVEKTLWQLEHHRRSADSKEEISSKEYQSLRVLIGDQSRFIMPSLLSIIKDPTIPADMRRLAAHFFVRGGTRQGKIGPHLSSEEKDWNRHITRDDVLLRSFLWSSQAHEEEIQRKIGEMEQWYAENSSYYCFQPTTKEKIAIFFS